VPKTRNQFMGKLLSDVTVPGAALGLVAHLVFACVLLECAIPAAETPNLRLELPAAPPQEPITPIPLALALDPPRVALGERLFHDVRLSHDNTRACAMCHPLQRGGMDGQSHVRVAHGTALLRNTPTIFNVGLNAALNWDGVATTQESGLIVQFLQTLTGDYHGRPVATAAQEPSDGDE
jgi:cytochrome c peroxidase